MYRWIEADARMVAVVRPAALFDTKGLKKVIEALVHEGDGDVVIKMRHRGRGEMATYAYAFARGLPVPTVHAQLKRMRNLYEQGDTEELRGFPKPKEAASR